MLQMRPPAFHFPWVETESGWDADVTAYHIWEEKLSSIRSWSLISPNCNRKLYPGGEGAQKGTVLSLLESPGPVIALTKWAPSSSQPPGACRLLQTREKLSFLSKCWWLWLIIKILSAACFLSFNKSWISMKTTQALTLHISQRAVWSWLLLHE